MEHTRAGSLFALAPQHGKQTGRSRSFSHTAIITAAMTTSSRICRILYGMKLQIWINGEDCGTISEPFAQIYLRALRQARPQDEVIVQPVPDLQESSSRPAAFLSASSPPSSEP